MHLQNSFLIGDLFIILLQHSFFFFFQSTVNEEGDVYFCPGGFPSQLRLPAGDNPAVWPVTLGNPSPANTVGRSSAFYCCRSSHSPWGRGGGGEGPD